MTADSQLPWFIYLLNLCLSVSSVQLFFCQPSRSVCISPSVYPVHYKLMDRKMADFFDACKSFTNWFIDNRHLPHEQTHHCSILQYIIGPVPCTLLLFVCGFLSFCLPSHSVYLPPSVCSSSPSIYIASGTELIIWLTWCSGYPYAD